MTRGTADEIARWADLHYPECGPHFVKSREVRTWDERKATV